jgi:glycosyltransferase involved in cell wall biosynthesis
MLFPSAEAAGLVWVEALGCGLPVVAFDGPTEIAAMAKRLPGITISRTGSNRSYNISAYAESICAASNKAWNRKNIMKLALLKYDWGIIAGEFLDKYRYLMSIEE